jgi:S1-C subfamily serine protease
LFDGKGMKIDGVSSDKPAEKGGILKGDIVIKIDKYDIEKVYI